jgi:hypothetical protein
MDNTSFPLEVFPKPFRALIEHLKKVTGFDRNLSAISFLSASATYIGSSVQLFNGTYKSKPIFWCVLVGRSGIGKSHIMELPFKYLQSLENRDWEQYELSLQSIDEESHLPEPKSTILIDATMESIYKAHKLNDKGLVLIKDEVNAWLKDFNKYNNGGGEKDTLLSLFDGKQLKVHRASKNTLHLSGTCINIIGGVQPERLSYFLSDDNLVSGFFHRFLFSRVEEDVPLLHSREKLNTELLEQVNIIFQKLYEFENTTLDVPSEVFNLYLKWQNEKTLENFKNPFGEKLQSKLQTYMWRFCIILDLLEQVTNDERRTDITQDTMNRAIILAEYFRNESTAIYQESFRENILESEPEAFQKIYKKLDNREYTTKELIDLLSNVWQTDNINKKLACKELFTRIKRGVYIKTIRDAKK